MTCELPCCFHWRSALLFYQSPPVSVTSATYADVVPPRARLRLDSKVRTRRSLSAVGHTIEISATHHPYLPRQRPADIMPGEETHKEFDDDLVHYEEEDETTTDASKAAEGKDAKK